jgi:hypothetical protein
MSLLILILVVIFLLLLLILQQSRIKKLQQQTAIFAQEVKKPDQGLSVDRDINIETADTLRERIKELAMLNEIGHAISAAINIDELIERIYVQTKRIMDVSAFYIALYHLQKNELRVIFDVLDDVRQKSEETTRKFGNGRTEYIIRTMKPLLIKSNPQKVYRELGIRR